MVVGALVPPDAARVATRAILASQQCTRMPQNDAEEPFPPICVHSCAPMSVRNGATVYTNAPKRLREVIFANLCTLLCPHGRSRTGRGHGSHDIDGPMALVMLAQVLGPDAYAAGAVTQPPTRTHEASLKTTVYGTAVRTLGWDGTRKEVVCTAPSGEGTSWRPSSGSIMATRTRYALISLQMLPNTLHSRRASDTFPPPARV